MKPQDGAYVRMDDGSEHSDGHSDVEIGDVAAHTESPAHRRGRMWSREDLMVDSGAYSGCDSDVRSPVKARPVRSAHLHSDVAPYMSLGHTLDRRNRRARAAYTRPSWKGWFRWVGVSEELSNVVTVGLGFMFLFAGLLALQHHMETSGYHVSWVLAYCGYLLSLFWAPVMIRYFGLRVSCAVGGLLGLVFMAFSLGGTIVLMWPSAVGAGVGMALMLPAQATYMLLNSRADNVGLYAGVFVTLYQLHYPIGNALARTLDHYEAFSPLVFTVLLVLGGVGLSYLLTLRRIKSVEATMRDEQLDVLDMAELESRAVGHVLRDTLWRPLIPVAALLGATEMAYVYFLVMKNGDVDANHTVYILCLFGLAQAVGSLVGGLAHDRWGYKRVMVVAMMFEVVACLLAWRAWERPDDTVVLYYLTLMFFGVGDSALVMLTYTTIGALFATRLEAGFSAFRVVSGTALCVTWLLGVALRVEAALGLVTVLLAVAMVGTIRFIGTFTHSELFL